MSFAVDAFKFLLRARAAGVAYIDCDGCILKRYSVPPELNLSWTQSLLWWRDNLQATPTVLSRIAFCYLLRFVGVRLVLWTNRAQEHIFVTLEALGEHCLLFDDMLFRDGCKIQDRLDGPVMDDQEAFLSCGSVPGLLVGSR